MPEIAHSQPSHPTVGVLFVHGVGSQKPGDSLYQWAEPLYSWLTAWSEGAGATTAVIEDVMTRGGPGDEPAHVRVRLEGPYGSHSFVLAESCWANAFPPPSFARIFRWSMRFVVRALRRLSQRVAIKRKDLDEATKVEWYHLVFPGVYVMSLLFAAIWLVAIPVLFVALVALAWIVCLALWVGRYIPGWGNNVADVQVALAGSAGDSWSLLESPFRRAAMLQTIDEDIAWVATSSSIVLIVAHSQGAALVCQLLRRPRPEVQALVTLGAATRLLGTSDDDTGLVVEEVLVQNRELVWENFWSPLDPFSAGPMTNEPTDRIIEHMVANSQSPFKDHTTYPENSEQVLAPIALLLGRLSGRPFDTRPDDREPLELAPLRRIERGKMLWDARALLTVAAFVAGALAVHLAPGNLHLSLPKIATTIWRKQWVSLLKSQLQTLAWGAAGATAMWVFFRLTIRTAWNAWNQRAAQALLARQSGGASPMSHFLYGSATFFLVIGSTVLLVLDGALGAIPGDTGFAVSSALVYLLLGTLIAIRPEFEPAPKQSQSAFGRRVDEWITAWRTAREKQDAASAHGPEPRNED